MDHETVVPPQLDEFWVDVATAELKEPEWIIEGVLPPGLVIVGGPAKSMKTTGVMGLSALVSGHECGLFPSFMSKVVHSGRVMLLEAEHEAGEIRYMLEKDMGVRLRKDGSLKSVYDHADFRLDDRDALKRLFEWLDVWKPRLFVIDPLREFHECEEKDSGEMQRLMRPLRRWALANNATVLLIHHTSKPGQDHSGVYGSLDLRGSSAFSGMANGMLMFTPTKADGVVTVSAKFKRGATWERTIQLGIWGNDAREVLTGNDVTVLRALGGNIRYPTPVAIGEVLKRDIRSVRESLKTLARNGFVIGDDADMWVATGKKL